MGAVGAHDRMGSRMRLALAQINTTIGDFGGNLAKVRAAIARAREAGADLVVLPELALCGYPPMDLLDRPSFLREQAAALEALRSDTRGIAVVTGAVMPVREAPDADAESDGASRAVPDAGAQPDRRRRIANAAVALAEGEIVHVQSKTLLPTYDVFDEARYFEPARERSLWTWRGRRIALLICEDVWSGEFWGRTRPYAIDPVADAVARGAELLLTISASPWEQGRIGFRERMLCDATARHGVPLVFLNLVGGNDELIFDGSSFASRDGRITHRLARFTEDFAVLDPFAGAPEPEPVEPDVELLERALVLGIRDYLHKLGLERVVIGLSGGVDSSVTAHLAERSLGAEHVLGVLMPGPFSSEHSVTDAAALARNLGIEKRLVRIDSIYKAFLEQFAGLFGPAESYGLTQENLQARIRGTLLMAVSNHEGRIVLATGNKSELSVGYTTLYGDLVGGLAVLGDVLKRDVYALARHANREGERIPRHTIEKPPSAELAPDQLDTDTLPPYEALDAILEQAIEARVPPAELRPPPGSDAESLRWVLRAIDGNEYKRRQAPLVLRVSGKAFGTGRRLPIVHRSGWGL